MSRVFCTLVALVAVGLLSGCGDSRKAARGAGASLKDPLDELGQMLKGLADEKRKPPAKLAEMEAIEPTIPLAAPLIRSGELVYLWGAEYASGSNKVAAHEKKAPTDGGWVLLQDGTVKE